MKEPEPQKEHKEACQKPAIFQLVKNHLFFALFRIVLIAAWTALFFCKNKLTFAFAAAFFAVTCTAEILIFLLLYAKTFARKKTVNFPHFVLLILQIGAVAGFANHLSGGNLKSTLFIAGATSIVSAFYFITFLLRQKIAKND